MKVGNKVLFSGYAKLAEGTYGAEVIKSVGIVVVVDMDDGRIIDADCTLPTAVARRLIAEILIGRSLAAGPEQPVAEIAAAYQDGSLRAIIAAVRTVYSRYLNHLHAERSRIAIPVLAEQRYETRDATAS